QHGPAIGVVRSLLDSPFQTSPRRGVLFGVDTLEMREAAEHCLVGGKLVGIPVAKNLTHGVRQNAVGVGDGRDDPRNDVVLELKNSFGAEGTFIRLSPQIDV